ncbi:hypothetical protein [Frankia sp. Cas4]|uniref:hypothetical protein n=1 Tax=Frankia sp. Cas4 TaxID=3073927 RepID=UPI002AD3408F|nr:hypothetical protein [Frankia sp. Cas4]
MTVIPLTAPASAPNRPAVADTDPHGPDRFVAVVVAAGQMHAVGPFDDRDEAAAAGDALADSHPDTRMHAVIELVDVTTADLLLTLTGDLRATDGAA